MHLQYLMRDAENQLDQKIHQKSWKNLVDSELGIGWWHVMNNLPYFCHNDELSSSLSWLFTNRFRVLFISFAENSQIFLKIYIILILLTFMYLVTLYQKTEL